MLYSDVLEANNIAGCVRWKKLRNIQLLLLCELQIIYPDIYQVTFSDLLTQPSP